MAKKPRSQRRKAGKTIETISDDDNAASRTTSIDVLSDSYTIADSDTVLSASDFGFDEEEEEDDDEYLTGKKQSDSNDSVVAAATAKQNRLVEVLQQLQELPTEKRSTKREGVLRKAYKAITQTATGPIGWKTLSNYQEDVRTACFYSLRQKSNPTEQYAACRVLEAASVLLGAEEDEHYQALTSPLKILSVKSPSTAIPVRSAALRAWSLSNFINNSDQVECHALLDIC